MYVKRIIWEEIMEAVLVVRANRLKKVDLFFESRFNNLFGSDYDGLLIIILLFFTWLLMRYRKQALRECDAFLNASSSFKQVLL